MESDDSEAATAQRLPWDRPRRAVELRRLEGREEQQLLDSAMPPGASLQSVTRARPLLLAVALMTASCALLGFVLWSIRHAAVSAQPKEGLTAVSVGDQWVMPKVSKAKLMQKHQAEVNAFMTYQMKSCKRYNVSVTCDWTKKWSCPGQPIGYKGTAEDDGSLGYKCCCSFKFWDPSTDTSVDPTTSAPPGSADAPRRNSQAQVSAPQWRPQEIEPTDATPENSDMPSRSAQRGPKAAQVFASNEK
jgi:hypothetical protein